MMISQKTVTKILGATQIEEVVGDFVTLKKRGANFVGLCPFHNEKTPSFNVSPTREIFKCFGCGKAGNAVTFLMEHEKYNYPEALRWLANKYHIEVEEEQDSEEFRIEQDEAASIYIVLDYARNYYHNYLLNSEEGQSIGIPYFLSRGIDKDLIEKFRLGLSPSGFDDFTREALKNGYKEEFLVASGLSIKTYDGRLIDRFRERAMFSITSVTGRTLGFGGRTLRKDPKEAKYINSPETKVYSKSNVLFGLEQAKGAIRKADECFLVEGYTDVLALHRAGIENVVASLGTSLTENHVRLVKRYTNNLTFIFDGDEAGIKASLRAIDIALKEEVKVKAVALPEGEDPDVFARDNSHLAVRDYITTNSVDFIIFKTNLLFKEGSTDPIQRTANIRNILQSIAIIPSHITRSMYVHELSHVLEMDEEDLNTELNRQIINISKSQFQKPVEAEHQKIEKLPSADAEIYQSSCHEQEKEVIRVLLLYGNKEFNEKTVADTIIPIIQETEWENAVMSSIFNYYLEYMQKNGKGPDMQEFLHHPNLEFQNYAVEFSIQPYTISDQWNLRMNRGTFDESAYIREVYSAIMHFKLRKLQITKKYNLKGMKKASLAKEEIDMMQKVQKKVDQDIIEISKELGLVIY